MEAKSNESRWMRLQRGQALVEYWPTIPAAIAVMIAGSIIAQSIGGAFQKTADALCSPPAPIEEGSPVAALGPHSVEAAGWVYDPETDRTTVAYRVTNGGDPAISHWVIAMDEATYADVLQVEEASVNADGSTTPMPANWSYGVDPTTGVTGMKFDTGYSSGGGGNGGNGGGNGGNGGNGNGNGGGNHPKIASSFYSIQAIETDGETRIISITLDGNYSFGAVSVTIKAGQQVWTSDVTVSSGASAATANGGCTES